MVELFDHQKDAVSKIRNGSILYGSVGSGKSITILQYYMENEAPKDIYVITTARKRDELDWIREAAKFGIGITADETLAGVLHIDSWQNIDKYKDVEDCYFIFDEQRVVGSGAWAKAFIRIARQNRWNLLSATPGDTWMDYIPVFVANNLYKNRSEFLREHVVFAPYSKFPKIVRYTGTATLEKWRNLLLVEMPYLKHTERVLIDLEMAYDVIRFKQIQKDRWNIYNEEPLKDVSEMMRVMRRLVNSDPSRLYAIRKLLKDHERLIIFYTFNYELEILRRLEDTIEVAEWNGHKKQPTPTGDKWVYLVQYVAGAEAWECTTTNAMVFYSLTYSYKNFEQAQGRIDRITTPYSTLYYYLLVSNAMIDKAIKRSLEKKEHFNERTFAEKTYHVWGDL